MDTKYKFFQHKECEFFPCHSLNQNCMFCYCPLYGSDSICQKVGKPESLQLPEGTFIKDCSHCDFPHNRENFDLMMCALREMIYGDLADNYGGGLPKSEDLPKLIEELQILKDSKASLLNELTSNKISLNEFAKRHSKIQLAINIKSTFVDYLFKEDGSKNKSI